ncbi:MAG: hypothetical protein D6725_15990 [Planctomycetota bacterium]|nr:MAG: hypothetical protein D6725_15990 [Planctomycetota bacterium]
MTAGVGPQTSLSKRLRRRRRRNLQVAIPLLFGGLLLAGLVWLYWEVTPELSGRLHAHVAEEPPPPVHVTGEEFGVGPETRELVREYLAEHPERIATDVMLTEIRGTKHGLEIAVSASTRTRFVVVDLSQDPTLRGYYNEHAEELIGRHERQLRKAGKRFFQSWAELISSRIAPDVELLMEHRNRFVLAATVEGLGLVVHAVARDQPYPCVYERDNRLYFLLPRDVKSFRLEGRTLEDGSRPFPGNYVVVIRQSEAGQRPSSTPTDGDRSHGN